MRDPNRIYSHAADEDGKISPTTMITLGPFLTRRSVPLLASPEFLNTGYVIESAFPDDAFQIPIYRHLAGYRAEKPWFDDYYVAEADLPLGVMVWNSQEQHLGEGRLLALSAFLCGLYKQVPGLRDFTQLLTEIRAELPVSRGAWGRGKPAACPLIPALANHGFEVSSVLDYGQNLFVSLGWVFPQDREDVQSDVCLYAGELRFRPNPDRTLGNGKWSEPREHTVSELLWERLRNLAPKQPVQSLTPAAGEYVLSKYEWSRLALMTSKQARQARVDFICQHPQFWNEPKTLARSLQEAELYAPSTSVSQIARSLPALLDAAKAVLAATVAESER